VDSLARFGGGREEPQVFVRARGPRRWVNVALALIALVGSCWLSALTLGATSFGSLPRLPGVLRLQHRGMLAGSVVPIRAPAHVHLVAARRHVARADQIARA
jgi:hypothetical protein